LSEDDGLDDAASIWADVSVPWFSSCVGEASEVSDTCWLSRSKPVFCLLAYLVGDS